MEGIAPIVGIAAALVSAWYLARRSRRGGPENPKKTLHRMTLGDKETVRRLVALEVAKAPGISKLEAVQRAIDSMRRDNGARRLKSPEEMPLPRKTLRERYFSVRTTSGRWTIWAYLRYSFEVAAVVLVLYGICRLLGIDFSE